MRHERAAGLCETDLGEIRDGTSICNCRFRGHRREHRGFSGGGRPGRYFFGPGRPACGPERPGHLYEAYEKRRFHNLPGGGHDYGRIPGRAGRDFRLCEELLPGGCHPACEADRHAGDGGDPYPEYLRDGRKHAGKASRDDCDRRLHLCGGPRVRAGRDHPWRRYFPGGVWPSARPGAGGDCADPAGTD